MDWKNKIGQPQFRRVLCLVLAVLILVSLVAPGIPLTSMEQTDPLAQQQIRDIEPVRLGDEADGSNAIIIPVEGDDNAEQNLEVSEGDGIAGEGEAQTGETRPEELLPVEVEGDEIDQEQTSTGSGDQGQEDGNSGEEGGELNVGTPVLAGATVEAEVVEQFRAPKVWAFKMKRRKSYRRTIGHRQNMTRVKIGEIKAN